MEQQQQPEMNEGSDGEETSGIEGWVSDADEMDGDFEGMQDDDRIEEDGDGGADAVEEERYQAEVAQAHQAQAAPEEDQGFEGQAFAELMPRLPPPDQNPDPNNLDPRLVSFVLNNLQYHGQAAMILTEHERRQALAIKAAVQEDEELTEISDLRYAHLAIIDGDDVQTALDRVRHFQEWRDEYQLQDTLEEGKAMMRKFFKQQPGAVLSVSYNSIDGNYVYIYDQVAFSPHNCMRSPEDWKIGIAFCFYVFQAMSPNFFAIRQGCVFIGECEGYNWTMVNLECTRRMWDEVFSIYPMRIRELKCFHSGVVANLLLAMLKPFLPQDLQRKVNLGCQFEGRLDTYYTVPDWETASQKTLSEIDYYLETRYANEQEFIL